MSLQITGRPYWNASITTSGPVSHQIDGTITQSIRDISLPRSARSYGPANVTFARPPFSRASTCSRNSIGWISRFAPKTVRWPSKSSPEEAHRVEQHVRALVGVELPEECEPIARPHLGCVGHSVGDRHHALRLDLDPVGGEAPGDVLVADVLVRRDEQVDERQVRLDEALSHVEDLGADLGEALVTAARRLLLAQLTLGVAPHHLAVAVADRQVLVQGVDDRHVRQRVLRDAHDVVTEEDRVLEVHDVGLLGEQEVAEEPRQDLLVRATSRTARRSARGRRRCSCRRGTGSDRRSTIENGDQPWWPVGSVNGGPARAM